MFESMTRKKKPSRPYHHGDLKRALIEESIALISEEGVEALTVAEVGRRVGVSTAAPYKHFPDRRALLQAIASEANRRLAASIIEAVGGCSDPVEAFRLSGVAFIRWAAENPALHRLTTDPALLDYSSRPEGIDAPEALEGTMEAFWTDLAALVRSGEALSATHPLIEQLRGRALAQGMANFFVSGIFGSLGISTGDAERLAHAVTGVDVPAVRARRRRAAKK